MNDISSMSEWTQTVIFHLTQDYTNHHSLSLDHGDGLSLYILYMAASVICLIVKAAHVISRSETFGGFSSHSNLKSSKSLKWFARPFIFLRPFSLLFPDSSFSIVLLYPAVQNTHPSLFCMVYFLISSWSPCQSHLIKGNLLDSADIPYQPSHILLYFSPQHFLHLTKCVFTCLFAQIILIVF